MGTMEQTDQVVSRLSKLEAFKERFGFDYPSGPKPERTARQAALFALEHEQELKENPRAFEHEVFSLAGRILGMRRFGKAAFFHLQDQSGKLQAFIEFSGVEPETFEKFKLLDIGDIVWVLGPLFLRVREKLRFEYRRLSCFPRRFTRCPRNGTVFRTKSYGFESAT